MFDVAHVRREGTKIRTEREPRGELHPFVRTTDHQTERVSW